ncbi:uncharacterized protein LOC119605862 [Lucilia sericata]|uniref:uncharacterized protein LOC119605862 n=1 Tax=Lucilia sericata TaxID=13632 RepID=UPI0018A83F93|nr:uncharacterized protein LOC119605862 [Lucilia sericata]
MEERLIEAIRKRPFIFDKQSLMYRNKLAREKAWKSVSQVVGVSVKQCMARWRSLRDRYVREIAKAKDPDSVGRPTWRYMKQLSFIEQHVKPKRRLSYLDHTAEADAQDPGEFIFSEIVKDSKPGEFQIEIKRPDPVVNYENECDEEDILPMLQQVGRVETPPPRPDTPPKKRQKMQENAQERFEKLCSAVTDLIESKKQSYKKSRNEDFLKVLDGYLLKLPEEEQDDLKIRILNMVHVNPLE